MEKNLENDTQKSDKDICNNNINTDTDTPNLQDLLNNFNSQDNDISQIFNNFSKGDLGDAIKQFTNIIKTSQDKSENNINNLDDVEQDSNDDDFDGDFELNLDKYFISKDGKNICDVLSDIKSELLDIKLKL
jgi:hypothetical protein